MVCFSPLQAWYSCKFTKNGKREVVFSPPRQFLNIKPYELKLPCGQCCGCRMEYSRQWAVRCMHEADLYDENSFITLTYNDRHLPKHGSLNYDHWTRFMKRLRKKFSSGFVYYDRKTGKRHMYWRNGIRFYMGPEYGDKSGRPHYHALLFNLDFPDKYVHSIRNGIPLYRSDILDSLWVDPKTGESLGYASVGSVTYESAAYVARYMMKKVKGKDRDFRYVDIDFETGELVDISPERARMSLRPGLAKDWFLENKDDVFPSDEVVVNGRKSRPPKYYDRIYESIDPSVFEFIKQSRVIDASKFAWNNTPRRLADRKICFERNILSKLERNLGE